ncbi:MAG: hypothetical protein Fur0032_16920 [Terrimicrobiaceae bacterium]
MNAAELFQAHPEADAVLSDLRKTRRDAYRAASTLLASRRKLRPAFLEKKPLPERHRWLVGELTRRSNLDVSTEILQSWLMTSREGMLVAFLDSLKIPHDGKGLIESLPDEPPEADLEAAVDALLQSWPSWEVSVYLNLFCEMDIAQWPRLREIVSRRLKSPPPSQT